MRWAFVSAAADKIRVFLFLIYAEHDFLFADVDALRDLVGANHPFFFVLHREPRTLMYAGTARAATTIIGAATATPLKRRGKS